MTSTFKDSIGVVASTAESSLEWYKKQLEASAITEPMAQYAGFKLMARQPFNGYEMPYFDVDGNQTAISTFRRHITDEYWAEYERLKTLHLEDPKTHEKPEKPVKCIRIKGVGSGLELPYWPRVMNVDHRKNMHDLSTGILVTEGEKKALCAQAQMLKEGLPFSCVALNGVGKWRYFIDHFRSFGYTASAAGKTVRRPIIIALDWNKENLDVQRAEDSLYDFFASTGAVVTILRWPVEAAAGEQKLDDYIAAGGSIMKAIEHSVELDLNPMNRRYFSTRYAKFEGGILRFSDATILTTTQFTNQYSHLNSIVQGRNGRASRVYHAKEWLDHPYVPVITRTFFEPWGIFELNREVPDVRGTEFNLFNGWGCAPAEGDITPFLNLLDNLFPDPAHKEWVMTWIAHLVQRPQELCATYLALSSMIHGTGKGLFARTLRLIVSDRYCVSGTKEAWTGRFNGEWEGKLLVLTDELLMDKAEERRRMGEKVKSMVGNPVVSLERKGATAIEHHNHLRFIFTGNSEKIAHLDPLDRRAGVFESQKRLDPSAGEAYDSWLRNPPTRSYLLGYFGILPLNGWNPGAPAIKTLAREASIQSSLGPLGAFIEDLRAEVAMPGRDLASPDEIATAYEFSTGDKWRSGKASLCAALKRHGAIATHYDDLKAREVSVFSVDGGNVRLWILRNFDKYRGCGVGEIVSSYKRQSGGKY